MTQINPEILQRLHVKVKELRDNHADEISVTSYLQQALLNQVEGITPTQAECIIVELEEGIHEFNLKFNANLASGQSFDIMALLTDQNETDQFNAIVNLITVLRIEADGNMDITQEMIDSIRTEVINNREANTENIKKLNEEFIEALAQIKVAPVREELMNRILQNSMLTPETVADYCENTDNVLYMATSAYIARAVEGGDFNDLPEDNRMLGAVMAAGCTQAVNDIRLVQGDITESTWYVITKNILGTLLYMTLILAGILFMVTIVGAIVLPVLSVVGYNLFTVALATVFMIYSVSEMTDGVIDCIGTIMDYASRVYDNFALWIVGKMGRKTECSEGEAKLQQDIQVTETVKVSDESLVDESTLRPALIKG